MNAIKLVVGAQTVKRFRFRKRSKPRMPKTWDQLKEPEKVEDLRRDMVRVFEILNRLGNTDQFLFERINAMKSTLEEVSKARPGTVGS